MSRSLTRFAAITAATLAVGTLGMTGASAQSADPYQQCKNGAHVNFKDPATGKPFANQGRCVSTLARGGALVPVVAPVEVRIFASENGAVSEGVTVTVKGQAGTYPVTITVNGKTVLTQDVTLTYYGKDGQPIDPNNYRAQLDTKLAPGTYEVVVTVEDQTFTQTVVVPGLQPRLFAEFDENYTNDAVMIVNGGVAGTMGTVELLSPDNSVVVQMPVPFDGNNRYHGGFGVLPTDCALYPVKVRVTAVVDANPAGWTYETVTSTETYTPTACL